MARRAQGLVRPWPLLDEAWGRKPPNWYAASMRQRVPPPRDDDGPRTLDSCDSITSTAPSAEAGVAMDRDGGAIECALTQDDAPDHEMAPAAASPT